jgi:hypothetical protein
MCAQPVGLDTLKATYVENHLPLSSVLSSSFVGAIVIHSPRPQMLRGCPRKTWGPLNRPLSPPGTSQPRADARERSLLTSALTSILAVLNLSPFAAEPPHLSRPPFSSNFRRLGYSRLPADSDCIPTTLHEWMPPSEEAN